MLTLLKNHKTILTLLTITTLLYSAYQLYQTGYKHGLTTAQLEYQNKQQQAVARAIKQANKINAENEKIEEAYWQAKAQDQQKIKTIEKSIIKYVQTTNPGTCDLDDDELRILTDLTHIVNGQPKNKN